MCMKRAYSIQDDGWLLKLCKLYICLSSYSKIICSLFHSTCFMSENSVVCLMISLSIQFKEMFQAHVFPLRCLHFLQRECNLSGEDKEKMRPTYGPPACLCVRGVFFFFSLFILGNQNIVSALHYSHNIFPTNQVLPTCQPRRDTRPFKTFC